MKTRARFVSASRSMDDELILSFAVDEANLEELQEKDLELNIQPYKKRRSLNANAYFWQLCDKIAKVLKSDKETIYLMKLKDVGVFKVIEVIEEAAVMIEPFFRLVEVDHYFHTLVENADGELEQITMVSLHCYHGSHEYDTKQMSELIESTVQDAQELGIETMTPDEIEHLCSLWNPR